MEEIQVAGLLDQIPFLMDLPETVQQLILRITLIFLALFLIWIVRNIATAILMAPIRRLVGRTNSDMDDQIIDAIQRPVRLAVIGVSLAAISAILSFGAELDNLTDTVARSLVLSAVVFLVYNLIDVIAVTSTSLRRITGISIEERLLPFLRTVAKVTILVIGGLTIINEFGFDVTGLVASFGIIGLAFSLAAQDTAANVFGFTAIVSDNPFTIGDYIVTGDFAGTVEKVGVRSTRVRKLDQSLVTVPNNSLTNAAVTNWSRLSRRRLDFYVGLTYDTTSDQMRAVLHDLREMLKAREQVDPETVIVHFVEFGGSSLNIRIIAYIKIADWAEYTAETELINLEIMDIIANNGLSIAFPSTSLYVETLPRPATKALQSMPQQPLIPEADKPAPPMAEEPVETGRSEATFQDNPAASNEVDGDGDGR